MRAVTKRLGDIATVFNGKTPSKVEQRDVGFPVLKIKDVSETGQFRGTFASFVDESLANKHSARWVHSGDTLILNAAHNADYVASKMFFASDDVAGTLPTGEWLLVRSHTSEVMPEYLHYWLRSAGAKKAVRFLVKGIHLYPKDVAELSVPWFSLPEQRRIVDILSRAEGIVRLRREAEKKAAELIPALFLDMFGDPATNPKGWPMETVGDVIESADYGSSTKSSEDGSGLPLIRMGNVDYAGTLNLSDLKFVNLPDSEAEKYRLRDGDILFNRTNSKELVGKTGMWSNEREAVVASYFIRLRVDRDRLHPSYLWAFMNSRHMKRVIFDTARGAIGQANINSKELKAFPVAVPPLTLQQSYATRLADIRSIQSQQAAATATAQATFDALLAQVFSK